VNDHAELPTQKCSPHPLPDGQHVVQVDFSRNLRASQNPTHTFSVWSLFLCSHAGLELGSALTWRLSWHWSSRV